MLINILELPDLNKYMHLFRAVLLFVCLCVPIAIDIVHGTAYSLC